MYVCTRFSIPRSNLSFPDSWLWLQDIILPREKNTRFPPSRLQQKHDVIEDHLTNLRWRSTQPCPNFTHRARDGLPAIRPWTPGNFSSVIWSSPSCLGLFACLCKVARVSLSNFFFTTVITEECQTPRQASTQTNLFCLHVLADQLTAHRFSWKRFTKDHTLLKILP